MVFGIVIAIAFIALIAVIVYNEDLKYRLPTHSMANTLKVAAFEESIGRELYIILKYDDGSKHVLDIKNGVGAGEPQKYFLPGLTDGNITVHITLERFLTFDKDVMIFHNANELKRNGLLIYFDGWYRMYVISGKTKICYKYNEEDDSWSVLENPPPISHDPAGRGFVPDDYTPSWPENKWEYIEVEK